MFRSFISAALCGLFLASCAQPTKMLWVRIDGQRVSTNPVLLQQAEVDKTICLGERQKAGLSGVTVASGGIAGAIAMQERTQAADQVAAGCMAEKGYLMVPEDQAAAKIAELAAIAEQKRQQEAASAAKPLPKSKMNPKNSKPAS